MKITNNGYAQLVSVFTIFCSTGVQVDKGGIASIVNSNANFGDLCLVATGYGKRDFSGTVYNPINKAYPDDPEFNQYYPTGFWPNNAQVRVFIPDLADRPHISLVMEVEPPDLYADYLGVVGPYVNEQGFSGFLNAVPNLGVLSTGTITINGIDTTGIAIGNAMYIRDQFGNQTGTNGILYAATDTVVTNIGYQSVTLSKALTSGGSDLTNTTSSINVNYFNLYFCGNAYYTVLSSEIGDNPISVGTNVIRDAATGDQRPSHISSLQRLNSIVVQAIKNQLITPTTGTSTVTQITMPLLTDGGLAETFIGQRNSLLMDINTLKMSIEVPGRTDCEVGKIIEFFYPNVDSKNSETTKEEDKTLWDPLISGFYLITALHHRITPFQHSMFLEISKDSYKNALLEVEGSSGDDAATTPPATTPTT